MPERIVQTRAFELAARIGWMVKGMVFGLMGILALRVLWGDRDADADMQGAIASLADEPGGLVVMWVIVVGFTAYGLWRLSVAIFDSEDYGRDFMGIVRRLGFAGVGFFYGFIAVWLASSLIGGAPPENNNDADVWAARAMELPAGPWLLGLAAAVMFGAGLFQVYRAWAAADHQHMPEERMSFVSRHVGSWIGRAGVAARGVAFGAIGFFLARAGLQEDPDEARDLGEALVALAEYPILVAIIGASFIAYGLHCLMNARYRTIGPDEMRDVGKKRNGRDVGY